MKFNRQVFLVATAMLLAACESTSRQGATSVPVVAFQKAPQYPIELAKSGTTGVAVVEFIVTTTGAVAEPRVVNQCPPEFARAAIAAVSAWRFKPGLLDGRPVNCRMKVPVMFDLKEAKGDAEIVRPNMR